MRISRWKREMQTLVSELPSCSAAPPPIGTGNCNQVKCHECIQFIHIPNTLVISLPSPSASRLGRLLSPDHHTSAHSPICCRGLPRLIGLEPLVDSRDHFTARPTLSTLLPPNDIFLTGATVFCQKHPSSRTACRCNGVDLVTAIGRAKQQLAVHLVLDTRCEQRAHTDT